MVRVGVGVRVGVRVGVGVGDGVTAADFSLVVEKVVRKGVAYIGTKTGMSGQQQCGPSGWLAEAGRT